MEYKIVIVLPAYNAGKTLLQTLAEIPLEYRNHVILVDDASTDNTVEIARNAGLIVIEHKKNHGYGGNQKTCYREALKIGADIVIMVHPDHQYDATMIPHLVRPLLQNEADAVFGSRMLGGKPLEGGMPYWKYLACFANGFRQYCIPSLPYRNSFRISRIYAQIPRDCPT